MTAKADESHFQRVLFRMEEDGLIVRKNDEVSLTEKGKQVAARLLEKLKP